MLRTLILIPESIAGLPVAGMGWLLIVWVLLSIGLLGYLVSRQGLTSDTLSYLPMIVIIACIIIFVLPQMQVIEYGSRGIPIRGYGVMLLLGVVSGVGLAAHRAQRMGVQAEVIYSLAVWMTVSGILGARVFYVIQYWSNFQADSFPDTLKNIFSITEGGLVVYGSLIGGMIGFAIFMKKNHLPALAMADLIAPSLFLGLFFGRIGCLLNGCCYGGVCDYPWAVQFPQQSPPYQRHAESGEFYGFRLAETPEGEVVVAAIQENSQAASSGLRVGDQLLEVDLYKVKPYIDPETKISYTALFIAKTHLKVPFQVKLDKPVASRLVFKESGIIKFTLPAKPAHSLPIHPAQIYSSINAAILCLLLLAVYPYRRKDGEVIALLLATYSISRFLLEIIRSDESSFQGTGLTISQNVSLILFVVACGLMVYLKTQSKQLALPKNA